MPTPTDTMPTLPRWLRESRSTLRGTRARMRRITPAAPRETAQADLLQPGTLVEGKYEIRALLGSGGMGQVYEAHDRLLNRTVAIKLAWPHLGDEAGDQALRREAQVLAAFRHPGLVTAHALGLHEGRPFLVMERLTGGSLSARLRALHPGRLPLDETLAVLSAIADTLSVLHANGLAHCDLKPSNIMLAPGRVVLLDFGIVRIDSCRGDARSGSEALISGSPHYMAPEAIAGQVQPGRAHLVDLYALGVLGFLLTAGRPPFDHDDALELMVQHLSTVPPLLGTIAPETPRGLERLVASLLAKRPDDRPADIDEVRGLLRQLEDAGRRAAA